jgi:hypothetical protein
VDSPITAAYLKVLAYSAKVAQVICKAASLRIGSQRDGGGGSEIQNY